MKLPKDLPKERERVFNELFFNSFPNRSTNGAFFGNGAFGDTLKVIYEHFYS